MRIPISYKKIAEKAIKYAISNGCSEARVSVVVSTSNSFEYRNIQLDKLQQNSENKFYLELFVEGRYGFFSTNRLDENELQPFIDQAIESTKLLSPDPNRKLPDPNRYFKGKVASLRQFDKAYDTITAEEKIALIKETVEKVYNTDKRIISVSSFFEDGCSAEYTIASNGFEAETQDTAYSIGAEVTLKTESDARAEDYWIENSITWKKLKKDGISDIALDKAIKKISQTKSESGAYDMILDNTLSTRLLSPIIAAMQGSSLQQKSSFLLDRLNTQITSPILTLIDKPHTIGNFGARWFDGEGVATQERTIINRGILKTYFIDTYNSLKMHIEPTISSPSVIVATPGKRNFKEILSNMEKGIWITGFNGGNCNPTTGDFSFGIEGFLIKNGEATQAISEMNITGNMLNLWESLIEVGNDPRPYTSWQIPSLLFRNIKFSGL